MASSSRGHKPPLALELTTTCSSEMSVGLTAEVVHREASRKRQGRTCKLHTEQERRLPSPPPPCPALPPPRWGNKPASFASLRGDGCEPMRHSPPTYRTASSAKSALFILTVAAFYRAAAPGGTRSGSAGFCLYIGWRTFTVKCVFFLTRNKNTRKKV